MAVDASRGQIVTGGAGDLAGVAHIPEAAALPGDVVGPERSSGARVEEEQLAQGGGGDVVAASPPARAQVAPPPVLPTLPPLPEMPPEPLLDSPLPPSSAPPSDEPAPEAPPPAFIDNAALEQRLAQSEQLVKNSQPTV